MRASLHNLGCKVNFYETEAMQQELEKNGYEIVEFGEPCDVTIINTCSVTNMADRKSRQMLHKARAASPDGILIAAGCYVESAPASVLQEIKADILIGNHQKSELIQKIEEFRKENKQEKIIPAIGKVKEYEELKIEKTADHTRAFMKIQDGCNQFCSYCIIPYTRGRIRSRAKENIIEEAEKLAKAGYHEIVFTGIHLGSYGDGKGKDLLDIFRHCAGIDGIRRIRLGSLEPGIMSEEFVRELSKIEPVCPHFHLSLQSGCDEVLKRMNRKYSTEEYFAACERLRRYFKNPALTTDVIVGFPGETVEEFEKTKEFVKKAAFFEMHIFKYSKRNGTLAANMENQVEESVKTLRSRELIEIGRKMKENYRMQFLRQEKEVLIEEKIALHDKEYWTGHTKEYVRVAFCAEKAPGLKKNVLAMGKVKKILTEDLLLCELVTVCP